MQFKYFGYGKKILEALKYHEAPILLHFDF